MYHQTLTLAMADFTSTRGNLSSSRQKILGRLLADNSLCLRLLGCCMCVGHVLCCCLCLCSDYELPTIKKVKVGGKS